MSLPGTAAIFRPRPIGRRAAAAAVAVVMLGACGGGAAQTQESTEGAAPASESGGAAGSGTSVDIVDNAFEPSDVEVATGEQVEWTNTGDATHTVTFEDGQDSGNLDSGATYSRTFDEAGDYPYVCSIHPQMAGTVTVAE